MSSAFRVALTALRAGDWRAQCALLAVLLLATVAVWRWWSARRRAASAFHVTAEPAPPRFDVDDAAGYEYLKAHGFVVFRGVATPAEVEAARDHLWAFLEGTKLGIKRYEPATWDRWCGMASVGIIAGHGIGNSRFLWFIRTLKPIRAVFARVWQCDPLQLLTSFDGCGVFRPWNASSEGKAHWKTKGSWFHIDQCPRAKPGLSSMQGLVSLYDQTPATGGLVVVPDSHLRFASAADVPHSGDFVSLPAAHPLLHARSSLLVSCSAGDLILWDSRTVHCNSPALTPTHRDTRRADGRGVDLLRAVAYVCFSPLQLCANPAVLIAEREMAFDKRQTTNHWPTEFHPTEQGVSQALAAIGNPVRALLSDDDYRLVTGGYRNPNAALDANAKPKRKRRSKSKSSFSAKPQPSPIPESPADVDDTDDAEAGSGADADADSPDHKSA